MKLMAAGGAAPAKSTRPERNSHAMSTYYHEPPEELSTDTRDLHRAFRTLIEEWEAVDWYQQRIDLTPDAELKSVLGHLRDEEIEHASMVLEWLRRRMPQVDQRLRTYLFTSAPIVSVEKAAGGGSTDGAAAEKRDLGIGKFTKGG